MPGSARAIAWRRGGEKLNEEAEVLVVGAVLIWVTSVHVRTGSREMRKRHACLRVSARGLRHQAPRTRRQATRTVLQRVRRGRTGANNCAHCEHTRRKARPHAQRPDVASRRGAAGHGGLVPASLEQESSMQKNYVWIVQLFPLVLS